MLMCNQLTGFGGGGGPDPNGANNPSTLSATPAMTSNTTPSGVVFGSGSGNPFEDANNKYMWFNQLISGDPSRYGYTNSDMGTVFMGYQFSSSVQINKVGLVPGNNDANKAASAFTIQASNDGSSYVDLLSVSGLTAASYDPNNYNWFTWVNSNKYLYYRILLQGSIEIGSNTRTWYTEMRFVEAA